MSNPGLFLAFLAAISVLTVTPGLDTALILRTASIDGRRTAAMAGLGIVLGCLAWGAAVSLGLGAVLRASELAYSLVKYAGAAFLIWVGARLLINPRTALDTNNPGPAAKGRREAFLRGLFTNLLNPKVGIFYVSFLPQFVPAGARVAPYLFFLACVHVVLTIAWFAALIAATAPIARFLRQPRAVQWLDRLTGGIFLAFGVKLAVSSAH